MAFYSPAAGVSLTDTQETPLIKRLVCLANSRKLQGRCIAGREWLEEGPGAWIRPVSHREHQEVSERERMYEDGSDPQLLDIIDVPLIEPRAGRPQTENWLLDPKWYWRKVGRLGATDPTGRGSCSESTLVAIGSAIGFGFAAIGLFTLTAASGGLLIAGAVVGFDVGAPLFVLSINDAVNNC